MGIYPKRISNALGQVEIPDGMPISKCIQQLRQVRTLKGLNQIDIANYIGVDLKTLQRIEKGKRSPSLIVLEMYAKALGGEISFAGWT